MQHDSKSDGFTLVELLVVVLIVGVLTSLAIPVYARATHSATSKSCQANQRTILGVMEFAISNDVDVSAASEGQFAPSGSGWYSILVPEWVQASPACPSDRASYYLTAGGRIVGDSGSEALFKNGHRLQ